MPSHAERVVWLQDGKYGYYSCLACRAKRRVVTRDAPYDSGWQVRDIRDGGRWKPAPECAASLDNANDMRALISRVEALDEHGNPAPR